MLDRDDLAQEAAIGIWLNEHRIDPDRPEPAQKRFLRLSGRHDALNAIDRERRRRGLPVQKRDEDDEDPAERVPAPRSVQPDYQVLMEEFRWVLIVFKLALEAELTPAQQIVNRRIWGEIDAPYPLSDGSFRFHRCAIRQRARELAHREDLEWLGSLLDSALKGV